MSDQYIRMRYSDDGYTFSYWQEEPIGEVGEYGKTVAFTRLGQFRERSFHVQVSSKRRRDILGAVGVLERTNG